MANSTAFEWLCEELEKNTTLEQLAVRGTVRIALKQGGLEATSATGDQLAVVLERVLPGELTDRGIEDAEGVCRQIVARLEEIPVYPSSPNTPEAVFERLAG
jgi:hypothetical protein